MKAYPPPPFPGKGVTYVQPRDARLPVAGLLPPWDGPAEAA